VYRNTAVEAVVSIAAEGPLVLNPPVMAYRPKVNRRVTLYIAAVHT